MKNRTPQKRTLRGWAARLAMLLLLAAPLATPVRAASTEEKAEAVDGRLEGFATQGNLPETGSTVLTWMLFGVLGSVAVGVLFMNAKRTHLD